MCKECGQEVIAIERYSVTWVVLLGTIREALANASHELKQLNELLDTPHWRNASHVAMELRAMARDKLAAAAALGAGPGTAQHRELVAAFQFWLGGGA